MARKSHLRWLYRVGTSKKRKTNTTAVVIPPDVLEAAGRKAGDPVNVECMTKNGRKYIVLIPVYVDTVPKI